MIDRRTTGTIRLPGAAVLLAGILGSLAAEPPALELFSSSPAPHGSQTSNEAYPIGNGKLAAMVFGGIGEELIQFNEDTVWAGQPNDYTHPGAADHLARIRELIWDGEGHAAYEEVAGDHFMSIPLRQSPYQPTANLRLGFDHDQVEDYRRTLDLETAIATVRYELDGVTFTRECFASHPDRVIVVRLTASEPGSIDVDASLDTRHPENEPRVDGADLILDAKVKDDPRPTRQDESRVRFRARARVVAEGGKLQAEGSSLAIRGADSVTVVLAAASNVENYASLEADPAKLADATLEAAAAKDHAALRAAHLADYQPLFQRVEIDLGGGRDSLETAQRLEAVSGPDALAEDLSLVALNFQMARYLYIAGSRAGSQPLNLQGKWNDEFDPAWESKMTLNINQEMNYWAVEVANLPECFRPMVDLVKDLSKSGATAAREHYGAGGWMVHHNTDLWRGAAPINSPGGMWPTGGAWLSLHLWDHYAYTQDEDYLREVYPLMKGAARFFADFLVMDPREPTEANPQWGRYLVTNPSHSPELPNPALGDDGELVAGTTMDCQLIRALFSRVIEASRVLGVDEELREMLAAKRAKLPPNQIGRHGQLQEWLEDVDRPNQHRHLSHLVGLFPDDQISAIHEPTLAEACRVVLDWKGDPTNNTSWSQAWKMCLRNALFDGDHAFMILSNLFRTSHSDNLTFSIKGGGAAENQVDGNFGAAMGTTMFFLQSRRGEIHLLPALPESIAQGSVTGLRAPGGFTVDLDWNEGRLTRARIHSAEGRDCLLRVDAPLRVIRDGEPVPLRTDDANLHGFATEAGAEYEILPAAAD